MTPIIKILRLNMRRLLALSFTLLLPGCLIQPSALDFFNKNLGPIFGVKLEYLKPLPSPEPSPSTNLEGHRLRNAAFIKEAYLVLLERNVTETEFNRWMNTLDQGASFEGIYNGIVLGEEYKAKEVGVAPPDAIRIYARIMTKLDMDSRFDPQNFKEDQNKNGESNASISESTVKPPKEAEDALKKELLQKYAKQAVNKSLYQLKRECALEALKTMDIKKAYKDKLATWYGRFAAFTNHEFKVDFGISQRNQASDITHYRWALDASEDQIKWEIFNRIHRLFNSSKI
jgi:hypothetical protein